ncbi:MAG: MFS transporter [Deltaproteobacteria bacterium]|nr:MAG: MFS transporter [Deltaproteobacteria bacterium]
MGIKKVYLISLSVFPLMVCSGIIYSILSLYMAALGASKSQIGLLYTSGAASAAVTSPMMGRLADKVGKRPILLGSMVIFALVFIGYALSDNFTDLYPVMMAEGVGWGGTGAVTVALIADIVPERRRGTAMGIYNTAWNVGWIVGPTMGGVLSDHLGFRPTFLLCVLIIVTGIILGLLFLPKGLKG